MASMSIARKAAVLVAGGSVYGTAVYCTYHYMRLQKASQEFSGNCCGGGGVSHVDNPNRAQQFQRIAACYDDQIGRDEFFMGMNLLRRALLYWHAAGTCLEVGAGTARNLPYYRLLPSNNNTANKNNGVHRVVLTDSSDQMLLQAKEKVQQLSPAWKRSKFAVIEADAAQLDMLPTNSFDTVVDTFGLCSYNDPVVVLKELARVCKPDGKILLLEHGRSHTYAFVTRHLDQHAEQHAANWGCVWNRDLDALFEAAGDQLEVQTKSLWHFGTTYYVVCRPKKQKQEPEP